MQGGRDTNGKRPARVARRRPKLWREDELDHPWFHVDELRDVLRQAEAHARLRERSAAPDRG
jgi:hypothetical protein